MLPTQVVTAASDWRQALVWLNSAVCGLPLLLLLLPAEAELDLDLQLQQAKEAAAAEAAAAARSRGFKPLEEMTFGERMRYEVINSFKQVGFGIPIVFELHHVASSTLALCHVTCYTVT
jgi:hypothetical protein